MLSQDANGHVLQAEGRFGGGEAERRMKLRRNTHRMWKRWGSQEDLKAKHRKSDKRQTAKNDGKSEL